ncbi:MAG: catalase family protein [Planctomycetaceae bacterium]
MRTLLILLIASVAANARGQTHDLDQGWTPEDREEFYFTAQGSQLIPYQWFLALEQVHNRRLFRDDENMRRYGVLPASASPRNPDALPVGFVRDGIDPEFNRLAGLRESDVSQIEAATRFEIKQAYLGSAFDEKLYPRERRSWFGLTCAACHTHEMEFAGDTIRIEGGSAQVDFESFLRDLGKSLDATHRNHKKLARFSERLGRDAGNVEQLREEVAQVADAVNRLVARNKAQHSYGFGRLDAFGAILNAVCETALDDSRNHRPSNAPVSYPTLWNTPRMSHVQWGASASNAENRNVGEVLGVFGAFSVAAGPGQFDSTVRLANLVRLEHGLLQNLRPPPWPEHILGKLDTEKVNLGRELFRQNCQSCHPLRKQDGSFALNHLGRIPIRTAMVGTDLQFLKNLSPEDLAFTGPLGPLLGGREQIPRIRLVAEVVERVKRKRDAIENTHVDSLHPGDPNRNAPGFISRPLEGIWASAPYFHNGSVPNLYETLLSAKQRSASFWVGSRRFDPLRVGFETTPAEIGSMFRVFDEHGIPIPGNSNAGHEGHGHDVHEGFTQTFENGEWRDFTDNERFALIEFMKWLPGPVTDEQVQLEQIPNGEEEQIAGIVDMTARRMQAMYRDKPILRGVHPKDHGCVTATFTVSPELPADLAVGVFQPGASYEALIRFSNASVIPGPDSTTDGDGSPVHGSRGMAVKLFGVRGEPLLPGSGALTQDFVMVNQPAFAFANVEDYEVITKLLLDPSVTDKSAEFVKRLMESGDPDKAERARRTAQIAARIASPQVDGDRGAFEMPPASPVDAAYFSAAPFLFGEHRVMKFRARPVNRSSDSPDVASPDYLRDALARRLQSEPVVFAFEIQVRDASELDVAADIENASTEWHDEFTAVATIEIPPQEFDSASLRERCEKLFFTPWHGVVEHRPLGGINRLRRAVYIKSSEVRGAQTER